MWCVHVTNNYQRRAREIGENTVGDLHGNENINKKTKKVSNNYTEFMSRIETIVSLSFQCNYGGTYRCAMK